MAIFRLCLAVGTFSVLREGSAVGNARDDGAAVPRRGTMVMPRKEQKLIYEQAQKAPSLRHYSSVEWKIMQDEMGRVKKEELEKYERELFAGKKKHVHEEARTAILMGGGPGSGKSSSRHICTEQLGKNSSEGDFVVLDPDDLLADLFSNNKNMYSRFGDYETPLGTSVASINNYHFKRAMQEGFDMIIDGTARNKKFVHNQLKRLKWKGYTTVLCVSLLDVPTALTRTKKRAEQIGRTVDIEYLKNTHKRVLEAIPAYFNMAELDKIYLIDNSKKRNLILESHWPHEKESNEQVPRATNCIDATAVRNYFPTLGRCN